MNKIKFLAIFLFMALLTIISCSKEENSTKLINKFGEFTITKTKDINLIEKIYSFNTENLLNKISKNSSEYDFENPSIISIDNSSISAISVSELHNSSNTNIEREKSFIIDKNGQVTKFFITEVNHISDNEKEVKYYDSSNNLINHFVINSQERTVNFIGTNSSKISNFQKKAAGCGQAVIDCMGDKYTNHGWDSVFLSIGTAFFPEVAVGVAVICLYESDECS